MTGCSAPQAPRQTSVAPSQYPQTPPPETPPPEYPIAPAPPVRTPQGLDAVIDISAHSTVSDFRLVRASNILGVIHKARRSNPNGHIVVFSDFATPGIAEHCRKLGAEAIFDKADGAARLIAHCMKLLPPRD